MQRNREPTTAPANFTTRTRFRTSSCPPLPSLVWFHLRMVNTNEGRTADDSRLALAYALRAAGKVKLHIWIRATMTRKVEVRPRARAHRGDIMSPEKRSALMSRIRGKHTGPERTLLAALTIAGAGWEQHATDLPGKPDFVLREHKLAIFVGGDFWHGWRFSTWRHKLSPAWEAKISRNRARDVSNHRRLRRLGWRVVRSWEHQLSRDLMWAAHLKDVY